MRKKLQLEDKIVVLNVCRFHKAERFYKGIDVYASISAEFALNVPELSDRFVFVLAGKANFSDVQEMQKAGLLVFANISDEELIDLYCAADIYANFSMWEGYNLGIGQALAMGLPVVASDIPAHRAFGVFTSNDITQIVTQIQVIADANSITDRQTKMTYWDDHLKQLEHIVDGALSKRLIA